MPSLDKIASEPCCHFGAKAILRKLGVDRNSGKRTKERKTERDTKVKKKKNIKIKLTRTKRDQRKSNSCGVHVLPTSGRSSVLILLPSVSSSNFRK